MKAWSLVHTGKISSWFLLVIINFLIVADLKDMKLQLALAAARPVPASLS